MLSCVMPGPVCHILGPHEQAPALRCLYGAGRAVAAKPPPRRLVASSAVWVAALRLQPQVPLLRLAGVHFSMLPEKTVFSRDLGSRV